MSMPSLVRQSIVRTIGVHRDYNILFVDDAFMRVFIPHYFGNEALELYSLNQIPASRCDMARLMLLYVFGGIYMDASFECLNTLDVLIHPNDELLLLQRDDLEKYRNSPEMAHVANGILGCPAGSAFILEAFRIALSNLKDGHLNKRVWAATGPRILNNLLVDGWADQLQINKLSYRRLTRDHLIHRRKSVDLQGKRTLNAWTELQKAGILPESYFNKHSQS